MTPIVRTAVSTVLFLVALGTALAQQVKTDFDHQANFSPYKTYSWQEVKPANSLWSHPFSPDLVLAKVPRLSLRQQQPPV